MTDVKWCCLFLGFAILTGCAAPGRPKGEEVSLEGSTDFKTLFSLNCSGCHGENGKNGPGRILNDPLYLSFISKAELRNVLVNGRPGTSMPAWSKAKGGPLNDHQIDALVDGIYSTWGRPFHARAPLPAYSAPMESGDAAHGKRLFTKDCFLCHGPGARIGLVTSASYLQLVTDQMIRTAIVVGRPDLGMPNYQILNAGKPLTNSDVTDLVAYLSSLRPMEGPNEGMYTKTQAPNQNGSTAAGNLGSGNGPGSPTQEHNEGHKHVNTSQEGGPIQSSRPSKENK